MPPVQLVKDYDNLPLVECYASQLNQVFMNLLSNALDALEEYTQQMGHQGPAFVPTIRIKTQALATGQVAVHITDNGGGMPEEVRARIFDDFFTTKEIGKGTGLGLPICQQLVVDKHHGELSCHSTPGEGTEFVIQIPVKQAYAVAPEPALARTAEFTRTRLCRHLTAVP